MLDYKLIEAMAMVAQEGGFDRAARALHLTQSAVSQRVKLLEEQTGQILLVRTSPPTLTDTGRQLLKHYRQVKRLEGDLFDRISSSFREDFSILPVGVNADSLTTWFFDAVRPFLDTERVVLDLSVDDQEQTHRLLKDGEVMGCVGDQAAAMQGCRVDYLGRMDYRLLASPGFSARWFPDGLTIDAIGRAPAVIFNRKDDLHNKLFRLAFGTVPAAIPAHFVPSSEKFVDLIASGLAYGMLPDLQSAKLLRDGRLVNLLPDHYVPVKLYWHCWNFRSELLERFTRALVAGARKVLHNRVD